MNVYKIANIADMVGASAGEAMEFLKALLQMVVIEAEFDYDSGTNAGTAAFFHEFICETPFAIPDWPPTDTTELVYQTLNEDSTCTQQITSLLKPRLSEGDLVAVIGTTTFNDELQNYSTVRFLSSTGPIIMQIGKAASTQGQDYAPFATALAKVYFDKTTVLNLRATIIAAKAERVGASVSAVN